jgi:small subunit ribosomal protein S10
MVNKNSNLICIILKAFDNSVLDSAVDHVIRIAKQERVKFSGPIPLPTKRTIWTVQRGPHIDKEAREQFERKIHKRLFYVSATPAFIDAIGRHSLASGVEAKITIGGAK